MAEEIVELRGHLIDSLILPKVLDAILTRGGRYEIQGIRVGVHARDPSFARLLVSHTDPRALEAIVREVARHGVEPVERKQARLARAPRDGVFPEGFYVTTNLETSIWIGGRWLKVRGPEMDSGVRVSRDGRSASTVKMAHVRKGDRIVLGHEGVRVVPVESHRPREEFEFMASEVSPEKPKGAIVAAVARLMRAERDSGRPILFVGGPAIVHSGAGPLLEKLIRAGWVQILFAGNALAAHDIEFALYGTSLGVSLRRGVLTRSGHENHLRAINAIRLAGGIREAVRKGILKSGIMHACVAKGVDFVLAGSIRDDGPLPDVITDIARAQDEMRRRCRRAGFALMVATLLHSVATCNMLPAHTRVVCVDIEPAVLTKVMDRGAFQTMGVVTDVEPFLRELLAELGIR